MGAARDWVGKAKEQLQADAALKFAYSVSPRDNLAASLWALPRLATRVALVLGTGGTFLHTSDRILRS